MQVIYVLGSGTQNSLFLRLKNTSFMTCVTMQGGGYLYLAVFCLTVFCSVTCGYSVALFILNS